MMTDEEDKGRKKMFKDRLRQNMHSAFSAHLQNHLGVVSFKLVSGEIAHRMCAERGVENPLAVDVLKESIRTRVLDNWKREADSLLVLTTQATLDVLSEEDLEEIKREAFVDVESWARDLLSMAPSAEGLDAAFKSPTVEPKNRKSDDDNA